MPEESIEIPQTKKWQTRHTDDTDNSCLTNISMSESLKCNYNILL